MKAPYLQDEEFLKKFAFMPFKSQYIRITAYDYKENPIRSVEGVCTSGTLSMDGKSAVRRTLSLSMVALDEENDFTDINNIFSINKKIGVEVGFDNQPRYLKKYQEYDKLWFPLGIFYIINPAITHQSAQVMISLTLRDKMAMLNGDCGGVLPSSIELSKVDEIDAAGALISSQPTIYQIIQELVNEFGYEDLNRILIRDLELKIRQAMQWVGNDPLYGHPLPNGNNKPGEIKNRLQNYIFASSEASLKEALGKEYSSALVKKFEFGDDIGYTLTDFVWPSGNGNELVSGYGDSVASILEKISSMLGNYEYFYDVDGNFHFQEIRNYFNTSKSTIDLRELDKEGYLPKRIDDKATFKFDDGTIVTGYSSNPRYDSIKNDFIIWGMKTTSSGQGTPIRYHLAIDHKPQVGQMLYDIYFIKGEDTQVDVETVEKPVRPYVYKSKSELDRVINKKTPGVQNNFYAIENAEVYTWDYEFTQLVPLRQNYKYSEYKIPNSTKTEIKFVYYYEKTPCYKSVSDFPKYPSNPDNTNTLIYCVSNKKFYIWVPDSKNTITYGDWKISDLDPAKRWVLTKATVKNIQQKKDESTYKIQWEQSSDFSEEVLQECEGARRIMRTQDWRTELLFSDLQTVNQPGGEPSAYYAELIEEWPKMYDIQNGRFYQTYIDHPSLLNYYLDFVDTDNSIMNFSVSEIGRRSYVTNDENLNCIFEEDMPELIFIEAGATEKEYKEMWEMADSYGYPLCTLDSGLMESIAQGGYRNSIYNFLQNLLFQYTDYNEAISISCVPIWHLEPNMRISVADKRAGINGDYNIDSISIPLGVGGMMSMQCSKILERYL